MAQNEPYSDETRMVTKIITPAAREPRLTWKGLAVAASDSIFAVRGRHDALITRHAHDFYEVQVAEHGWGWHETATGAGAFTRGTVVLLRPDAWHRTTGCRKLVSWACCFPSAVLGGPLAFLHADPVTAAWLAPDAAGRPVQLAESGVRRCVAILHELRTAEVTSHARRYALLAVLLAEVAEAAALSVDRVARRSPHAGVVRVAAAFDAAPERAWSMQQAAAEAGLSGAQFRRRFIDFAGVGPLAYVQQRRSERATALLTQRRFLKPFHAAFAADFLNLHLPN